VTPSHVGGTDQWMRLRCVGTSIKVRIWDDGSAEPGTWALDFVDTLFTKGHFGIVATASAAAQNYKLYSLVIEDLTDSNDDSISVTAGADNSSIFDSTFTRTW